MMKTLKINNKNVCRVCLEHKVMLNWNEEMFEFCSSTYKECYYKLTGFQENAEDPFPTNLCEVCSNELKNSYLLFKKALESLKILEVDLRVKELKTEETSTDICCSEPAIENQSQPFEFALSDDVSIIGSPEDDKTLIHIEEEMYTTSTFDEISATENSKNVAKESINNDADEMQTGYFIDIQNYGSSGEILLKQKLCESFDAELTKSTASTMAIKKRKRCDSSAVALVRGQGSQHIDTIYTNKAIKSSQKFTPTADTLLEEDTSNSCKVKTTVTNTINKAGKIRKKNLLMCAYCSLKVDGTNQLKQHEATHSENRKRTETCPQCGIKLYTKLALNNHMKIHDENRQKRYKCEFCEKAFFNRGGLNIHRRIHLGLMVTCMICSKEFYRQIDLDKHLLTHSVSPIQKTVKKIKYTVQCQYCNKSVLTNEWKEHKAVHMNQPAVKCIICEKNFFARNKCIKHLRRVHRKSKTEYEDFIHYYTDRNARTSIILLKQQETVQPLIE